MFLEISMQVRLICGLSQGKHKEQIVYSITMLLKLPYSCGAFLLARSLKIIVIHNQFIARKQLKFKYTPIYQQKLVLYITESFLQFEIMDKGHPKRKPIINLFDFANNLKPKQKQISQVKSEVEAVKQSQLKSQSKWTYGLDTLIHFNDSINLSSIKSKSNQSQSLNKTKPISQYELLIARAKQDVEKLKNRRVQSQLEWRKIQPQDKDRQNTSFDQSQVSSYDLESSAFPNTKYTKQYFDDDGFKQQIRREIAKSNALKLATKIKKIFYSKLLSQLKILNSLADLKKRWNQNMIKQIFESWKDAIDETHKRKHIRMAIIQRIKSKRDKKDEQQYVDKLLND